MSAMETDKIQDDNSGSTSVERRGFVLTRYLLLKIIFWFLIISMVPLLMVAIQSFKTSEKILKEMIPINLLVLAENKIKTIENYLLERKSFVISYQDNSQMLDLYENFSSAYAKGLDSEAYLKLEDETKDYFEKIKGYSGFEDVFLINLNGDIIFNTSKGEDLGGNLTSEMYRENAIGVLFAKVMQTKKFSISKYDYYQATNKPAIFLSTPLFNKAGIAKGILIFQLNNIKFYQVVNDYLGLGKTGETIIGTKKKDTVVILTPTRHDKSSAFRLKFDLKSPDFIPLIKSADTKAKGTGIFKDYRGKETVAVWDYFEMLDWGVVVKLDRDEGFNSIYLLAKTLKIMVVFVLCLILGVAVLVARSITNPIKQLTKAASLMAKGDLKQRVNLNSNDEIFILGSTFNSMCDGLEKSKKELLDYANNLESMVTERTLALKEEKETVVGLLNGMKQAVFTVSADMKIIPPVSKYTETVFQSNIIGGDICETVFKDIDRKSESFSGIKSALITIFGESELQWSLMEDNFPKEIKYYPGNKTTKNEEDARILKISYSPLWDANANLSKLMFVVDDMTEVLKLEREIEAQKNQTQKKTSMIHELVSIEPNELKDYFSGTKVLINDINKTVQSVEANLDFALVLRNLHTLKGNSRLFNLSSISSFVHLVEEEVISLISKFERKELRAVELQEKLSGIMRNVLGEVQEYASICRNIFRLDVGILGEIEKSVHENILALEEDFSKPDCFKDLDRLKNQIQKCTFAVQPLKQEGVLSSLDNFVKTIITVQRDPSGNLKEKLEGSINTLERKSINLYLNSSLHMPYSPSGENWGKIFTNFYNITNAFLGMNPNADKFDSLVDNCSKDLSQLSTLVSKNNMVYLGHISSSLQNTIKSNVSTKENLPLLKQVLKETWRYLFSVVGFYSLNTVDENIRKIILDFKLPAEGNMNTIKDLTENFKSSGFISDFILSISKSMLELKKISSLVSGLFTDESGFSATDLVDRALGKGIEIPSESELLKNLKAMSSNENEVGFIYQCFNLKGEKADRTFLYLKYLDVIQVVEGLIKNCDGNSSVIARAAVSEIPNVSLDRLKETLVKHEKNLPKDVLKEIRAAFTGLFEAPIKSSFSKYTSMVKNLSERYSKKIDFKVIGDDCTLDKEKLSKVHEAFIHLIRNSIDHGIETTEERKGNGKNPIGTLEIEIKQPINSEMLTIFMRDDGRGIDPLKVANKALQKNIINSKEMDRMSDEENINLIFRPGFSTQDVATELSGRGVGLDVVKEIAESLGGNVKVKSTVGKRTEFVLNVRANTDVSAA